MLITLSYSAPEGADHDSTAFGFLLFKHPAKLQSFDVTVGQAHVFYPEATPERTTVALMLELDPVELARSRRFTGDAFALAHYVNDRPYASSSMMAVALGKVFRTAMTGRSDSYPELAAGTIPLVVTVAAVPARGGAELVRELFEPLGWSVTADPIPLDPERADWGDSRFVDLRLEGSIRLADALNQLYVLLPVLDDAKHYWVSDDEVGKLVRAGEGWLADHPQKDLITRRYLRHEKRIVADAAARLANPDADGTVEEDENQPRAAPRLVDQRADAVMRALHDVRAHRVADLGCGEGALLARLLADSAFTEIVGTDVSSRSLTIAERRLDLRRAPDRVRERVRLLQSSVTYQDDRIAGMDAAVLMEVIEHIDLDRLPAAERAVWGLAQPEAVVVTTPNADYNALYPALPAGHLRHTDHRFEFTRDEFQGWASRVAGEYGYSVEFRTVGEVDERLGSPTQLALFLREAR
ncbi:3' terminal RNA ribose 2'-O-methyltransferase Hen1 [Homoserinibacter sp. GY 40078]|nr:3' terminal RNA ribose 2'-O-methyltransferase Hen1 [Homoserinibacter sp. GY 40078]TXK19971.1 3' terminal RNA ribose 2'-O-methyltransferase Hen1 [Homoserinibacter sp. GY 40078]